MKRSGISAFPVTHPVNRGIRALLRLAALALILITVSGTDASDTPPQLDASQEVIPSLGEPPLFPHEAPPPILRPRRALEQALGGFAVNIGSREEVRHFYTAVYQASEGIPIGWTGSQATCEAGTTLQEFKDAVERRTNFFRAMAGIPANVTLSLETSAKAQQAALMMSANNQLNHSPPTGWSCYTENGAEAAGNSNLSLGHNGPSAITGFIFDAGSNNSPVGHRRWILYPQTQIMGTGDIASSGSYPASHALWVFDSNIWAPRPATRSEYVSWPPPGYVPYMLVSPRWSFSYPDADFSSTLVTMTSGGNSVPVQLEQVHDGYGENTIVWAPNGLDPASPLTFPNPGADKTYTVTLSNVKINGAATSFTYDVTLFDPFLTGPDYVEPVLSGPTYLTAGTPVAYSILTVPGASGYDGRSGEIQTVLATEGAENGLTGVTVQVPVGYDIISTDVRASGTAAFHLTHPDFTDQVLTLHQEYLIGSGSRLEFKSRLGWATPGQAAVVEVSNDEGMSWQEVYRQIGTSTRGEQTFVSRSIDLSAFAEHLIMVRFAYRYTIGQLAYTQTDQGMGWYIDDISFSDTGALVNFTLTQGLSGPSFPFTAPENGTYVLQARGTGWGGYPFEWGPVLRVTAAAQATLSCSLEGSGTGIVISNPPGISCNAGACEALFDGGAIVTLSAVPSDTSIFAGWSGACSGASDCTLTLSSDAAVTAVFVDITGDLNGDDLLNLADAIIGMQIVSGMGSANLSTLFDVDGDGQTGTKEVVYILQRVSEMR